MVINVIIKRMIQTTRKTHEREEMIRACMLPFPTKKTARICLGNFHDTTLKMTH